jgi:anti-sigma B factor antagonist
VALEGRSRLRGSAPEGGCAYLTGSRDCLLIDPFDQEISMPQTSFAPSVATGERTATCRPTDIRRALLTIAEHRVGRRAVLSVAGEVDISTAADLRTAIETAGTRAFEVWVDLSETTFMDSSGLHAMAQARACLADANIRLALICTDGPVLRVIKLTGFDRIFEIHPSRSDANHAASA